MILRIHTGDNQVMRQISIWMEDYGLNLVTEKTEIVLLTNYHIPMNIEVQVRSGTIHKMCIRDSYYMNEGEFRRKIS